MTFTALLILISVLALSHSTAASPGTSTHYWDCCMVCLFETSHTLH
ncbi:hypothetical protein Vi05172_g12045 [Venturia inaequalis]|nr:hypothetical protein Vi05172_g12045 [Venturia inaequalis]